MSILNLKFTAQTVAAATGTTAKQVTDWCAQSLIIGQRERLGKGHKRELSFYNVMEVAGAVALMESGVRSPGDAFKAASFFSHMADDIGEFVRDDGVLECDFKPTRSPGLPFHFREGDTFLAVSGDMAEVLLSKNGTLIIDEIFPMVRRPVGFILLDMSAVFAQVMTRMHLDYRIVLDQEYSVAVVE